MGNPAVRVPHSKANDLRLLAGAGARNESCRSLARIFVIVHLALLATHLRDVGGRLGTQEVVRVLAGAALLAGRQGHHEGGRGQDNNELLHLKQQSLGVKGVKCRKIP